MNIDHGLKSQIAAPRNANFLDVRRLSILKIKIAVKTLKSDKIVSAMLVIIMPEKNLERGINIRKKHVRARRAGEKGQIVQLPMSFHVSNVKVICSKCGKATRIGYKIENNEKYRICKKCGKEI